MCCFLVLSSHHWARLCSGCASDSKSVPRQPNDTTWGPPLPSKFRSPGLNQLMQNGESERSRGKTCVYICIYDLERGVVVGGTFMVKGCGLWARLSHFSNNVLVVRSFEFYVILPIQTESPEGT